MSQPADYDAPDMRYFIDGEEVSESVAVRAEARGAAKVSQGASGVVPERLRQPGETQAEWLRPWLEMRSTRVIPPAGPAHDRRE
jgi:hypothetical protein